MSRLAKFLRDENGANAIEYALLAVLIAVVIVPALTLVGCRVAILFHRVGHVFPGGP